MVYRRTARSEKIRAESRARILSAARRLFARKGFDATTVQDIVAGAHTSVGNVYFYFADKAEILRTLLEDGLRATWARTQLVARQNDLSERTVLCYRPVSVSSRPSDTATGARKLTPASRPSAWHLCT